VPELTGESLNPPAGATADTPVRNHSLLGQYVPAVHAVQVSGRASSCVDTPGHPDFIAKIDRAPGYLL